MTTTIQNNPSSFITPNRVALFTPSNLLLEIARKIAILALFIIPLIALIIYWLKSNTPAPAHISIEQLRQSLQQKCPTLFQLINNYQNGMNISKADYEGACATILADELGMNSSEGTTEAVAIFQKIRKKLGMEEIVFTKGDPQVSATERPYAFFVKENGQFNLVIKHRTFYRICPQYLDDGTQTVMSRSVDLATIEAYQQVDKIFVSPAISENRSIFIGKIPVLNSGAIQTCITLFSYILAPSR